MKLFPAMSVGLALIGLSLPAHIVNAADAPAGRNESRPKVQRTWMPDASPSSFAVGFSHGMNLCFDPERGQAVYAWLGDFVDLKPTQEIKFPQDATIRGSIFYRAPQIAFSGPDATRAEVRFKGYHIGADNVVFRFEVNRCAVELTILPDQEKAGLICRFRVEQVKSALVYHPVNPNRIVIETGTPERAGSTLRITGGAVTQFSEILSPP